ncbi:cobalamin biosynthesis protein [Kitasatospora camelliae]|uniref:Cobalamin biosynthesis protein n=1 Tax=Kitasatospora camelliae TaxID=3156397 RepID=A0AAU8JZP8_9ACTN
MELVAGIGTRRGTSAEEILRLLDRALAEAGLTRDRIALLATVDAKAGEPGLRDAARVLGVPLVGHSPAALAAVAVPHPSDAVRAAVGTPSVAEAAALASAGAATGPAGAAVPAGSGAALIVPKTSSATATVAIAGPTDGVVT